MFALDLLRTRHRPRPLRGVRGWVASLRKNHPARDLETAAPAMLAELERLAETSPHLLADLGFRQTGQEQAGVTTWRRGALTVRRRRGSWFVHRAFHNPRG